ncbi:MAG TPA: pyridoxamine 5'-phosphate oxidase family protein [Vicinamibacteria bacterium]|nr:pyridoxamine 5'-phosphate oxidase family protein [Vicinamibacteria bacterium]
MTGVRLPDEIRPVMESGIPLVLSTCSKDGEPNVAVISQAYYVDAEHVALSYQFFSKTIRNVRENPRATLCLHDIWNARRFVLGLLYDRSETEGEVFERMSLEIEAIASATGMSGIFKLRSADIYRVTSVECLPCLPA